MVSIPTKDLKIIIDQLQKQLEYYNALLTPVVELTEEETQADAMKKRMVEAGMATYE